MRRGDNLDAYRELFAAAYRAMVTAAKRGDPDALEAIQHEPFWVTYAEVHLPCGVEAVVQAIHAARERRRRRRR